MSKKITPYSEYVLEGNWFIIQRTKYGRGSESKKTKKEIGRFNVMKSRAIRELWSRFGKELSICELRTIVNGIKFYCETELGKKMPKITRNTNRNFVLLVKYVEQNSDIIFPILDHCYFADENDNIIDRSEEIIFKN